MADHNRQPLKSSEALRDLVRKAVPVVHRDRRVRSVGVAADENGDPYLRVVRNMRKIVAHAAAPVPQVRGVSVRYVGVRKDPIPHLVAAPGGSVTQPEQNMFRPLVLGCELQPYTADDNDGNLQAKVVTVGSLAAAVTKDGESNDI